MTKKLELIIPTLATEREAIAKRAGVPIDEIIWGKRPTNASQNKIFVYIVYNTIHIFHNKAGDKVEKDILIIEIISPAPKMQAHISRVEEYHYRIGYSGYGGGDLPTINHRNCTASSIEDAISCSMFHLVSKRKEKEKQS